MNNIFIHIGARANSKGLRDKNILKFNGKPLILWSILLAKKINKKAQIIVNTDSNKIIKLAKTHKVNHILKRPSILSNDNASKFSAWKYACKYLLNKKLIDENDLFLDLDCTCPLRKLDDIKKLIKRFFNLRHSKKFDAIFTITEARRNPYFNMMEERNSYMKISKKLKKKIVRRQNAPKVYEHCGVGYALKPNFLLKKNNFLEGKLIGHKVPLITGFDIDNEFDLKMLELLTKYEKKFN